MITDVEVIAGIGMQIASRLRSLQSEEATPGCSADNSEDKIKALQSEIKHLRRIRTELEELFASRAYALRVERAS